MARKKIHDSNDIDEQEKFKDKAYSEIEVLSGIDFRTNRRLRKNEKEDVWSPTPFMMEKKDKRLVTTDLKHGGMSCPHRECSSKNSIPGNNGIQVKGFKFIGVK